MAKLEKKHYWMIGIGAAILIAGVVIYRYKTNKKKEEEEKKSFDGASRPRLGYGGENNQPVSNSNVDEQVGTFPLRFGSNNESVKVVQKYMNSTCPSELKKAEVFPLLIDGEWGDKTELASMACSSLKRNEIDAESFKRIMRDMLAANIA